MLYMWMILEEYKYANEWTVAEFVILNIIYLSMDSL